MPNIPTRPTLPTQGMGYAAPQATAPNMGMTPEELEMLRQQFMQSRLGQAAMPQDDMMTIQPYPNVGQPVNNAAFSNMGTLPQPAQDALSRFGGMSPMGGGFSPDIEAIRQRMAGYGQYGRFGQSNPFQGFQRGGQDYRTQIQELLAKYGRA
jgi:hypothetical protein